MKTHIIFVLTIVFAGSALAQGPFANELEALAKKIPHRTGTVRYPTGEPAAGVQVTFYPGSYSSDDDYNYHEAITDKNGHYEIIPPKKVSGFVFGGILLTNCIMARDFEKNFAAVQAFPVTTTNIDLTLQPAITLFGSVKNTEGTPVSGAEIGLAFLSARYAPEMRPPFKANEQGQFSIPALPQGVEYWISEIKAKGYGSTSGGGVSAKNTYTNSYEMPIFVLQRADRKLAGQVLDDDGNPIAGANLSFRGNGQPENSITRTDSKGNFFFDAVCDGKVDLSANWSGDPGSNDILAGSKEAQGGDTNIIIQLRDPRFPNWPGGITTKGRVFDPSGAPVSGVSLAIGDTPNPFQMITSDNNGKYKIHWYRIQNGQSSVNPNPKSTLFGRDTARNLAATQEIDATTTNLDLQLQPGCILSGSVQNSDGTPSTNAMVGLYMKFFRAQPLLEKIQTDANGFFSFKALPREGNYQLGVKAVNYGYSSMSAQFDSTSDKLQLQPIKLKATDLQLSGVVQDSDDKPISEANVSIRGRGQPIANIMTDAEGRFLFKNVVEGTAYQLAVNASNYGYVSMQVQFPIPSNSLELTPIKLKWANLQLAGMVEGPDNKPVSGVDVNLNGIGQPINHALTDAFGKFSFEHVAEGTINASAVIGVGGQQPMYGSLQVQSGDTNVVIRIHAQNN